MTITKQQNARASESGNVLFLILIAVALFAALSYAVTQSSRSGGGDASSEKSLVSSSQVTQYPSSVRTSIVRMIIGGTSVDQLLFDTPSSFAALSTTDMQKAGVFYPSGGGATYSTVPAEVMKTASSGPGNWVFSSKYQVKNIGLTDATKGDYNEIIAFLPGVSKALCTKLDTQLGITLDAGGYPPSIDTDMAGMPVAADNMDSGISPATGTPGIPATATGGVIGTANTQFIGQPFGCGRIGAASTAGTYVYYHVLVER